VDFIEVLDEIIRLDSTSAADRSILERWRNDERAPDIWETVADRLRRRGTANNAVPSIEFFKAFISDVLNAGSFAERHAQDLDNYQKDAKKLYEAATILRRLSGADTNWPPPVIGDVADQIARLEDIAQKLSAMPSISRKDMDRSRSRRIFISAVAWWFNNKDGGPDEEALGALGDLTEIVLKCGEVSADQVRAALRPTTEEARKPNPAIRQH
jgi:hypothetical protein